MSLEHRTRPADTGGPDTQAGITDLDARTEVVESEDRLPGARSAAEEVRPSGK
jgi:hypothetical protein